MTVALAVALATLHVEYDDLVTLYQWRYYFGYDLSTSYGRSTYGYGASVVYEEHLVELNSLTRFSIADAVYEELLAFFHLKLLTVNLYDCVHCCMCNN